MAVPLKKRHRNLKRGVPAHVVCGFDTEMFGIDTSGLKGRLAL